MCYFLAIGAVTEPWRLTSFLQEQLPLEVDLASEQPAISAAFPVEDVVRLVTHRGCSCSLLAPVSAVRTGREQARSIVSLTRACRRAIARAVSDLGAVRLYVRARGASPPASGRPPRLAMTLDEFLSAEAYLPANALVEIVARVPPESLN